MIALVADARAQWAELDQRIAAFDAELVRWVKENDFQTLTAAGKPPKIAIVAVMRKLVVLANALLRKSSPWMPKAASPRRIL